MIAQGKEGKYAEDKTCWNSDVGKSCGGEYDEIMEALIIALVAASPTRLSVVAVSVASLYTIYINNSFQPAVPAVSWAGQACTALHCLPRPRLATRSFYCIAVVTSQTVEPACRDCRSQPGLQTAIHSGTNRATNSTVWLRTWLLRKMSSSFIKLYLLLRGSDYGDPARGWAGLQHAGRGQPVLQLDPLPGLLHIGQLHLHTGLVQKSIFCNAYLFYWLVSADFTGLWRILLGLETFNTKNDPDCPHQSFGVERDGAGPPERLLPAAVPQPQQLPPQSVHLATQRLQFSFHIRNSLQLCVAHALTQTG